MFSLYASLEALDEQKINAFENEFGCKLPESYKAFLLKWNGGYANFGAFKYIDRNEEIIGGAHRFLGITSIEHRYSIQRHLIEFREDGFPLNLIPIAEDGGGNFLFLSADEPDKGKIFYWMHEIDPKEGIFFVANNFDEFLAMLFEEEIED